MRKIYLKLAASVLSVVIALSMIIGASYAWLTLSESPAVNGINVSIGGGHTILLAPDITETYTDENGREITVHYPGTFEDTLHFSGYSTYDYLNQAEGLSPVSTADGVHWILPVYDGETGRLADIRDFAVDSTLAKANQTEGEYTENDQPENGIGSYVYLDFWVVSPGAEYNLRVATDSKTNEGSFLMELPEAEETADGKFTLSDTSGHVAGIARVGFLVNSDTGDTKSMEFYSRSEEYHKNFNKLLGVYQEPGQAAEAGYVSRFSIYEPNATLHPQLPDREGAYLVTRPLKYGESGEISETNVADILAVQEPGSWRQQAGSMWLEQSFQASVAGKQDLNAETAAAAFYQDYLDGYIANYVASGNFFPSTAALYEEAALNGGTVSAEILGDRFAGAGVAEDVIITQLERNTPQRIRMFIWLEGQDADCTNTASVSSSSFSLGVELSGETIK